MTTKRVGLIGGGILAGALLIGTAGLALAQDPTASPGIDWMGSGGMMGGQGMTGSGGMMGGQGKAMSAMHAKMTASGSCDSDDMNAMHGGARTGR